VPEISRFFKEWRELVMSLVMRYNAHGLYIIPIIVNISIIGINCEGRFFLMPTKDPRGSREDQQTRIDPRLAARLARKKEQLDGYRPLSPATARRLHEDLRIQTTYNSNAIEGNTLTLRETQLILEYGVTSGGHPLREFLEATNTAGAFDAVAQLVDNGESVTLTTVTMLHKLVTEKILDHPGQFRRVPVHIRGATMTPPPASQVPDLMQQWVLWVNGAESKRYDSVTRAIIAHHGFESVHPFEDGNGRVGRLLLNMLLMREGYPPALVLRDWRERYVLALQRADQGDYTALLNVVGRAVESSLDLYLEACRATEHLYQPLAELAETLGIETDYLGWLARHGKIEATKRGRYWYSTLEAMKTYQQSAKEGMKQRGPRQRKERESQN